MFFFCFVFLFYSLLFPLNNFSINCFTEFIFRSKIKKTPNLYCTCVIFKWCKRKKKHPKKPKQNQPNPNQSHVLQSIGEILMSCQSSLDLVVFFFFYPFHFYIRIRTCYKGRVTWATVLGNGTAKTEVPCHSECGT